MNVNGQPIFVDGPADQSGDEELSDQQSQQSNHEPVQVVTRSDLCPVQHRDTSIFIKWILQAYTENTAVVLVTTYH